MKSLAIVSKGYETTNNISKQIKDIVKNEIKVNTYYIDDNIKDEYNEDFVIITNYLIKDLVLPKISKNSKYTIANRVINYRYLGELISLTPGSEVLLVNDHKVTCENTIKNLKQLGIDHIYYHPYYPGIEKYKKLQLAVTPGESYLAPECVKKIIDIGTREVDITTIVEVLLHFDLLNTVGKDLTSRFVSSIIDLSKQFNYEANHFLKLKNILQTIVDNSSDAIMYYSPSGEIIEVNNAFLNFMNISKERVITKKVKDVLPKLYKYTNIQVNKEIVYLNGKNVVINRTSIKRRKKIIGFMITIEDTNEIQEIEHKIRRNKRKKQEKPLYNFKDIISKSYSMKKTKELSKKISNSNSTVLITGESGTGKELLAQAIHNASNRRQKQFIPVNFAALPSSLIESELFGYTDGAFTGAKRGGKEGLFEKAHEGTIFLDEIGDAPLEFQARLLRVLQERQVRRVGATELIPLDVRVIAATNKNLEKLIEEGKFREDLFFRLNVLPINIPPLRERLEDIQLLLKHYLKKFTDSEFVNLEHFFENETIKYLMKYQWSGNVRELVNVMEYLINIKDENKLIKIIDLPDYVKKTFENKSRDIFKYKYSDHTIWMLKTLHQKGNIGRRKISKLSKKEGFEITESNARKLLKQMESEGLIEINKGVKGSSITQKGIKILNGLTG